MTTGRKPIRYQGKITTWKDEQGFGFIAPNGGGPLVFVHIKSFAAGATRPAGNDIVTFELTANERGQPRAENVAFVGGRAARSPTPQPGMSALAATVSFLVLVGVLVLAGKVPAFVLVMYVGISALTFIVYAVDKSAARNDRWRIQESTLHMLGLAGGWPGAIAAQKILRHKSKKQAFQAAFWFTVAVNCAALGWLLSSSGANLLRTITG